MLHSEINVGVRFIAIRCNTIVFHYASVDFCDQPVISQQNIAGRNINLQACGLPVIAFSACSETVKSLGLPKETTMSCIFRYEQINLFRSRQFERKNTYEDVATYHFFLSSQEVLQIGRVTLSTSCLEFDQ